MHRALYIIWPPELIGRRAEHSGDLPPAEPDHGPSYSTESDIYSIGIIIWEALSRCVPFADLDGNLQIMQAVRNGKRPFRCITSLCSGLELCKKSSASLPLKRHINERLLFVTSIATQCVFYEDTDLHAFFHDGAKLLLRITAMDIYQEWWPRLVPKKRERARSSRGKVFVVRCKKVLTLLNESTGRMLDQSAGQSADPEWAKNLSALWSHTCSVHIVLQSSRSRGSLLDDYCISATFLSLISKI
ncbi:hypothetical protein BV898_19464 [Hypsibius exemplaris]|uniref:Protein kinase domain-containing protein n=1 Tax=Hypsibius exemplaris TaxID=2072580 RepID=A0A9X6NKY1_HYPEX|nr:hypothetical protein BV898_19464 [Hypsibius exemplaris]